MRSVTKYLLCVLLIWSTGGAKAQLFRNVAIDADTLDFPNEPCIAINPANPREMMAGSNLNNVYFSIDGGLSWYKYYLYSPYGVYGDPVLLAGKDGAFYYIHNCRNPHISSWYRWFDREVCQRTDSASSALWTSSYTGWYEQPTMEDKPWGAVDYNNNTLYLTWTRFDRYMSSAVSDSSRILFSKSTDRGDTWSDPVCISKTTGDCTDEDGTDEGAVPCVGPNSELYVAWAGLDRIVFNASLDGGNTWLDSERVVTDVPGGWDYAIPGINRCNGLPFTACDNSNGPHRGNIYINWTDQRNGIANTDVWMVRSADSGKTWTTPMLVNNDSGIHQQFMSSMSVDPVTGYIYVLFYDRRNYTDTTVASVNYGHATDVYLAVSQDGAQSFKNYKINDSTLYPNAGFFFGDYTYVAACNNVVRPIWGYMRSNGQTCDQRVYTALVDSSILGVPVLTTLSSANDFRVWPNPAKSRAMVSFNLSTPGSVTLDLTDLSGRLVNRVISMESVAAGATTRTINLSELGIAPGTYIITLSTGFFHKSTKLVVE